VLGDACQLLIAKVHRTRPCLAIRSLCEQDDAIHTTRRQILVGVLGTPYLIVGVDRFGAWFLTTQNAAQFSLQSLLKCFVAQHTARL
jgi:hypothetical protein